MDNSNHNHESRNLLAREDSGNDITTNPSDNAIVSSVSSSPIEKYPLNNYTILVICCASVGGLMFGYDTGVISGVLVLLGDDLGHSLSSGELETITSVTALFALVGSLLAGVYANNFGRKYLIASSCVIFVIAALIMAFAGSFEILVLGRAIVGIAVGAASTTVPVYIAEASPSEHRGRLVAVNSVSTTAGQVLAYLSGAGFQYVPHGWRLMLGLSGIPPFLFLLVVAFIPESPRYLILKGRFTEASKVLAKLYPHSDISQIEQMIEAQIEEENREDTEDHSPFFRLFTIPSNFRALIVACGLMASQQLCGFNGFMYYSVSLFSSVGFQNPIAVSLVVSVTNFAFTWIAVKYIDIIGRRAILLRTVWIMVIALIAAAFSFNSLTTAVDPSFVAGLGISKFLTIIATFTFVASYSTGLGNIPWQAIEFLPLDVRSFGSMLISSTNWICNTLVSATFLSLLEWITPAGTFLLYAAFTLIAYIGIYLYYPEVAGMPLEEVNHVFKQGWKGLGSRRGPI